MESTKASRSYRDGPCGLHPNAGGIESLSGRRPSTSTGQTDGLTHGINNLNTGQLYTSFEDNSTLFKTTLRSAPAADAQLHNVHNGPGQTVHIVPHQAELT